MNSITSSLIEDKMSARLAALNLAYQIASDNASGGPSPFGGTVRGQVDVDKVVEHAGKLLAFIDT